MKLSRLFLFITVFTACTQEITAKKVIYIPLPDFAVEADIWAAGRKIGFGTGIMSMIKGEDLPQRLFETLNIIQTQEECGAQHKNLAYWRGKQAPDAIRKSILGLVSASSILQEVNARIDTKTEELDAHQKPRINKDEVSKLKKLTAMAFDPNEVAAVLTVNTKALNLIKKCQQLNYEVRIIDNFNNESAQRLAPKIQNALRKNKAKEVPIVVSGDIHLIKSPEFYKEIFSRFNTNPNDCIIIETHPTYAQYAVQAGVPMSNIIICTNIDDADANVSHAEKELREKHNIKI